MTIREHRFSFVVEQCFPVRIITLGQSRGFSKEIKHRTVDYKLAAEIATTFDFSTQYVSGDRCELSA